MNYEVKIERLVDFLKLKLIGIETLEGNLRATEMALEELSVESTLSSTGKPYWPGGITSSISEK